MRLFNCGKGRQGQNKRPCNVHLTHTASGASVTVRGRSKERNVAVALKELNKRVEAAKRSAQAAQKKARRDEKIHDHTIVRTYDYTRQQVRCHRTGKKFNLRPFMEGAIDFFQP